MCYSCILKYFHIPVVYSAIGGQGITQNAGKGGQFDKSKSKTISLPWDKARELCDELFDFYRHFLIWNHLTVVQDF